MAEHPLDQWLDPPAAPAGGHPLDQWLDGPAPPPLVPRGPGPWADDYQRGPAIDKRARIERETAAGQTEPPGFFSKLKASLPVVGAHDYTEADLPVLQQKPSLGDKLGGWLTGAGTDQFHQLRGGIQRDTPKLWREMEDIERLKGVIGGSALGAGAGGAVEGALASTLPKAAPYVADAAAGAVGAGASGENPAEGALLGTVGGKIFRGLAKWAGRGADAIKGSASPTGEDIRLLEKHGYEPSPVPTRPVARINDTQPAMPSEAQGLGADSAGRGEAGARSATEFEGELARRETRSKALLDAARARNNRPGGQGERVISTEPLIAAAERESATPTAKLLPGIPGNMKRVRSLLAQEEPTLEIHDANPKYNERGPVMVEEPGLDLKYKHREITQPDPNPIPGREKVPDTRPAYVDGKVIPQDPLYGEHSVIPSRPSYRGGEKLPMPPAVEKQVPLETKYVRTIPEEYTVSAGGQEPIRIGAGDVHGRVGEGPNRALKARDLDETRDALDDMSHIAELEGMSKNHLPMAKVSNQIRAQLEEHAPEVAGANARAHARMNRTEAVRKLTKDENTIPESFGTQLSGQGERGSKAVGVRTPRLEEFRRTFPTRPGFPKAKVEQLMDNPRLLLAEERLQLKKMPRIGGGDDTWLRSEPFVGRGLYPLLRAGQLASKYAPTVAGAAGAMGPEGTAKTGAVMGGLGVAGATYLPYLALRKFFGRDKGDQR